jgi:hypothetical protein
MYWPQCAALRLWADRRPGSSSNRHSKGGHRIRPIGPRHDAGTLAEHHQPSGMLHDRALVERTCDIEQIVAVNDSLDASTFAAGLEQLDRVAACQKNGRPISQRRLSLVLAPRGRAERAVSTPLPFPGMPAGVLRCRSRGRCLFRRLVKENS